jgi:hypothetical protein
MGNIFYANNSPNDDLESDFKKKALEDAIRVQHFS